MNKSRAPIMIAALLGTLTLAGCASASSADSGNAKTERHNCSIATLGATKETALRSFMAPDTTNHQGPITIDTYIDGKVILYYADDNSGVGRLIARDCGTGKVTRAQTLTGMGGRYLTQATSIYEGTL